MTHSHHSEETNHLEVKGQGLKVSASTLRPILSILCSAYNSSHTLSSSHCIPGSPPPLSTHNLHQALPPHPGNQITCMGRSLATRLPCSFPVPPPKLYILASLPLPYLQELPLSPNYVGPPHIPTLIPSSSLLLTS